VLTADIGGLTATTGKLNVRNVETLTLAAGSAATIDASLITGASVIGFTGGSNVSLTGLASGVAVGLGSGGTAYTAQLTAALADATGTADSLTFRLNSTAANSATLKTTNIETVTIAAVANVAQPNTTLNLADLTATTLNVTGDFGSNTLALGTLKNTVTTLDASGVTAGNVSGTIAFTGGATIRGGVGNNNFTGGDGNDTFVIASGFDHNDTINGGTGTADTLTATINNKSASMSGGVNFGQLSNVENVTINVADAIHSTDTAIKISTAGGLATATNLTVTGSNSLISFTSTGSLGSANARTIDFSKFAGAVDVQVAAASLIAANTITGGTGSTDSLHVELSNISAAPRISGFENIELRQNGTTSTVDMTNVTGATTVAVTGSGGNIILNNLAQTQAISIGIASTSALATNKLSQDFDDGRTITLNLANNSGTADSLTVNLNDVATITNGQTIVANGIENLTFNATTAAESFKLTVQNNVTANAVTHTYTGGASGQSITLTTLESNVSTVNAGTLASNLVITTRNNDGAMSITSGSGNDSFAMRNAADSLNAGTGTDTLTVIRSAPLGGIVVDLSSTVDQITFFNGGTNAAVQVGFENVDLSQYTGGFGSEVTGSSLANSITGTSMADVISAGAGNDTVVGGAGNDTITGGEGTDNITGGAGADRIVLTETTQARDTVVVAQGDTVLSITGTGNGGAVVGFDTIIDFNVGTTAAEKDLLDVAGTAALATAGANVNGTDSTLTVGGAVVAGHTIAATGLITFGTNAADVANNLVTVSSAEALAAVVQYLTLNDIGDAGMTVAFTANIGGARTFVYTQTTNDAGNYTLVELVGVTAAGLTTDVNSTGANTILIG